MRHSYSVSYSVQLYRTILAIANFRLGFHQQRVTISEKDDIVVNLPSVRIGGSVNLVFAYTGTCRLFIWAVAEVQFQFKRHVHQRLPVVQIYLLSVNKHGICIEVYLESIVNMISSVTESLDG